MGNNRGCKYSVAHKTLNPKDENDKPKYWDFDFEDMGTKDVPAFIDFILEKTGQSKLSYIGHSEGTTQFFIGSSLLPDYYQSKVNLYLAVTPIVRLHHTTDSGLKYLSEDLEDL